MQNDVYVQTLESFPQESFELIPGVDPRELEKLLQLEEEYEPTSHRDRNNPPSYQEFPLISNYPQDLSPPGPNLFHILDPRKEKNMKYTIKINKWFKDLTITFDENGDIIPYGYLATAFPEDYDVEYTGGDDSEVIDYQSRWITCQTLICYRCDMEPIWTWEDAVIVRFRVRRREGGEEEAEEEEEYDDEDEEEDDEEDYDDYCQRYEDSEGFMVHPRDY